MGDEQNVDRPQSRSIGRVLVAAGGARLLVLPLTGLCNLAIARMVTQAVGVDQFGIVMLVATLSQLLMFADLGTGAAVATARAQLDGAESPDHFRGTLLTAVRTTLVSAAALGMVAALLGLFGAWPWLLGFSGEGLSSSLNVSAVLALSAFAVALPFALGEAVLRGGGRMHEAVLLLGISPPAALVLTIVFSRLQAPPLAYALVLPLGALIAAACCALRAWSVDAATVRGLLRAVLRPRRYPGRPIASTAVPMFVVMVGLPIALQSDRVIIAHRLDPLELANYSYASQLYIPLWSVASTAAVALWPHFATGGDDRAALRRGWLTGLAILSGLGVTLAVAYLLFAGFLIDWMSDGQGSPSRSLLMAFAALIVVQCVHVTQGILLIAPDKLRFQAGCVIALVITNIPLSWVLTPTFGAAGPVYASAVTVLVCQLIPGVIVAAHSTRPPAARNTSDSIHA